MRIVFMGTSDFAVPILEKLCNSDHEVVAVYTKAPSKQGRGMSLQKSPVHHVADRYSIPVVTPKTLRNEGAVHELQEFDADVIVVASYGLIIPQTVLDLCKHGCINIHPSDLPRWRGAAPIQRTLMAADHKTAICIMKMDSGIDTGPVFTKKYFSVDNSKNIHQLTDEYAQIGAEMLTAVLYDIAAGKATLTPQTEDGATYANKITPEDCMIKWTENAAAIHGKIMALTPDAYFTHNGLKIKVIDSSLVSIDVIDPLYKHRTPGVVLTKNLDIICGDGHIVRINKLQKPGGKILDTKSFLCGYKLSPGDQI